MRNGIQDDPKLITMLTQGKSKNIAISLKRWIIWRLDCIYHTRRCVLVGIRIDHCSIGHTSFDKQTCERRASCQYCVGTSGWSGVENAYCRKSKTWCQTSGIIREMTCTVRYGGCDERFGKVLTMYVMTELMMTCKSHGKSQGKSQGSGKGDTKSPGWVKPKSLILTYTEKYVAKIMIIMMQIASVVTLLQGDGVDLFGTNLGVDPHIYIYISWSKT